MCSQIGIWEQESKTDGKKRIISAQYLQDKLFQRTLLDVLEPRAEKMFHEDSFGYRPNLGVAKAMYRVRERIKYGQDWLVDADIQSFFDSIPHPLLKKTLTRFIKDKAVMKIINCWLKQGAYHKSFLSTSRGVPQGAVLSPLLCNLYLHQFDMKLKKLISPLFVLLMIFSYFVVLVPKQKRHWNLRIINLTS